MSQKELLQLITTEENNIFRSPRKTIAARNMFFRIVKEEGLWHKVVKDEKLRFQLYEDQESLLSYTFIRVCQKIKNGEIKEFGQLSTLSGVIVNTLREVIREDGVLEWHKRKLIKEAAKTEEEYYKDYVEGVNPFGEIQKELDEIKIEILFFQALNEMGEICQRIIRYKHLEGLSHEEIVQQIDEIGTVAAARVKLAKCMEKLRELCFKKFRRYDK